LRQQNLTNHDFRHVSRRARLWKRFRIVGDVEETPRHSKLVFTKPGCQMLERLRKLAAEHEADLCAALAKEERDTLAALRRKIVAEQV
jgi:hypothetical protein